MVRLRNVVLVAAILALLLTIIGCGGTEQEQQSKTLTYWVPQEADSLEHDERALVSTSRRYLGTTFIRIS
jgi:hypothetical protein